MVALNKLPTVGAQPLMDVDPLRFVHEVCDLIDQDTEEEATNADDARADPSR
jgi:hypothetical protein